MKCSFCTCEMEPGTGVLYILKGGKTLPFCSKKCRLNSLKLKRKQRKVTWIRKDSKDDKKKLQASKKKATPKAKPKKEDK
jgi:large subunit ribosomal protein L24e